MAEQGGARQEEEEGYETFLRALVRYGSEIA